MTAIVRTSGLYPREERADAREDRRTLRKLAGDRDPLIRQLWQPENRRERRRLRK